MNRPIYNGPSIDNSVTLANILKCSQSLLERLSISSDLNYSTWREPKKNGGFRVIDAPKDELKQVQRAILVDVLRKVHFPSYLQGSIQGRDYITDATLHMRKKVLIGEDIKDFFPSVKSDVVLNIWRDFFGFSQWVSTTLTGLTTFRGYLPQGAPTSSYIANLVLWDIEPELQLKLYELGFTYSRYVDDISISCSHAASNGELKFVQDEVRSTLSIKGLALNLEKQTISESSGQMSVHNVIVNKGQPTKRKKERGKIRAAVRECEILAQEIGRSSREYQKIYSRAYGRVSEMSRYPLHRNAARKLFNRLEVVKPLGIIGSTDCQLSEQEALGLLMPENREVPSDVEVENWIAEHKDKKYLS